jgi:hypothetical protein
MSDDKKLTCRERVLSEGIKPEEIARADKKIAMVRELCEDKTVADAGEIEIKDVEAYVGRRLRVSELDALVMGKMVGPKGADGKSKKLVEVFKGIEEKADAEAFGEPYVRLWRNEVMGRARSG